MIIGITSTFVMEEQHDGPVPVERVTSEYIQCVAATGAVPILLPPVDGGQESNKRAARALVKRIDGLILAGGGDIAPDRYGESVRLPETTHISTARDAFELELARSAYEHNLPTLGICRGMQVMNVALGGTLYQDVHACNVTAAAHQQKPPYHIAQQRVDIVAGSALDQALHSTPCTATLPRTITVNSMHHQAVSSIAPSLQVSAFSSDGLIEGIEDPTHPFFLGVQWHPEYLDNSASLFQALTHAAQQAHLRPTAL